jgi:hypothetical protein
MPPEEELAALRAENTTLRAEVVRLQQVVVGLEAQLTELRHSPPPFVKPNKAPRAPASQPRRKRAASQNHGRRRAPPTVVRTHAYDTCPDCGYALRGQSIARRREVIDLPPPPPVGVIEYQVLKRYCPHCAQWCEPALPLDGLVVGQGRMSMRLLALVAWLRTTLRLPLRQIQTYLRQLHSLHLSVGELGNLLATVAAEGRAAVARIQAALQASPVLHMDETGWRENGQNGYVWVMTNAAGVSYFHYDHSRAGAVARGLSGPRYTGTLCTDFYAAYNDHACRHQRCWAHLLRDLAALAAAPAATGEVQEWVAAVGGLYKEGQALAERAPPPSGAEREHTAARLRQRAHELGLRWARAPKHPAHALCQRLLRHEGELFEYVRQAGVEATNNRAERAIRPLAVARKISGGTRSAGGSTTRMALQTLFTSWAAQGGDPLAECLAMLRAKTLLPSS